MVFLTFVCSFLSLNGPKIFGNRIKKGAMRMSVKSIIRRVPLGAALTGSGIFSSLAATAALA